MKNPLTSPFENRNNNYRAATKFKGDDPRKLPNVTQDIVGSSSFWPVEIHI